MVELGTVGASDVVGDAKGDSIACVGLAVDSVSDVAKTGAVPIPPNKIVATAKAASRVGTGLDFMGSLWLLRFLALPGAAARVVRH